MKKFKFINEDKNGQLLHIEDKVEYNDEIYTIAEEGDEMILLTDWNEKIAFPNPSEFICREDNEYWINGNKFKDLEKVEG